MKRIATLFLVIATTACCSMGGAPTKAVQTTTDPTPEEIAAVQDHHNKLQALEKQLQATMLKAQAAPGTEPDCVKACALAAQICGLAGKICTIAERHPEDSETRQLCADAAPRCEGARSRTSDACSCTN